MKKLTNVFEIAVLALATLLFLVGVCSCNSDITEETTQTVSTLSTECYIGTDKTLTKRSLLATEDNTMYFYLRVDNRIPGAASYPVDQYYPKGKNQSIKANYNKGTVNLNYGNWCYQDASYYTGVIKYIYDTTGKETLKAISSSPDWKELVKEAGISLNTDTLKVLWYITKYEDGFWHTDGVLTGVSTKDITEIPGIEEDKTKENRKNPVTQDSIEGGVEVDIHHQDHKDWSEIKTSIHIRALVDSVKVSIPMDNICEADDMAIRYFEYFDAINNTYAKVKVEHKTQSIEITIIASNIGCLIEQGDGLTVEIHNYVKDLTDDEIWENMKKATVITYSPTNVKGQITDYRGKNKSLSVE